MGILTFLNRLRNRNFKPSKSTSSIKKNKYQALVQLTYDDIPMQNIKVNHLGYSRDHALRDLEAKLKIKVVKINKR